MNDEYYMLMAIEEAKNAFNIGEVPIGCVVVSSDESLVVCGHNLVEKNKDQTFHAEVVCIKKTCKIIGDWRLDDFTMYSTLEPCVMCAGAIVLSRIKRVVWSSVDIRFGQSKFDIFGSCKHVCKIKTSSGILKEVSSSLLKNFFKNRRIANY